MEILLGKMRATSPIASLGLTMVTSAVKRRQSGDRVIRHFSPEISNQSADMVFGMEGNTEMTVNGKVTSCSVGSKVSHVVQCLRVNRGEPASSISSCRGLMYKWYALQSNNERKANGMQAVG